MGPVLVKTWREKYTGDLVQAIVDGRAMRDPMGANFAKNIAALRSGAAEYRQRQGNQP